MNTPPYIVTEIFTSIVADISAKLNTPISAHFGYVEELNETLIQMSKSPEKFDKKFPLIWLMEPFTLYAEPFIYARIDELRMFIMTDSRKEWKSYQRKENTFKPVLYPIRDELIKQMSSRPEFSNYEAEKNFKLTDHYYWGEDGKNVLNDIVDTISVRFQKVPVRNNKNCVTN